MKGNNMYTSQEHFKRKEISNWQRWKDTHKKIGYKSVHPSIKHAVQDTIRSLIQNIRTK